MSITVSFTTYSKRINSTKQLTMTSSHDCVFKNGCSMLNPILLLELESSSFPEYTGFQIGSKYYNVTDIRSVRNNLFEIYGEIDVLATYKSDIGASSEYVVRAASAYNLNIIDSMYPTLGYTTLTVKEFSTLHSAFNNGGSFVVGITNGLGVESAGVTYYILNYVTMARLLSFLFGGTWMVATDVSTDLQKELINPIQYIDSIKWYPFDIVNSSLISTTTGEIKFGYWGTGITAPIMSVTDSVAAFAESITLDNHPQHARGYYLNGSPYTLMSLQCYGFGMIPIDSNLFVSYNELTLGIGVDLITGRGRLSLRCGSNARLFHNQFGDVGVDCKISQITQGFMESVGDVSGGAFSLIAGNPIGFASGIVSGLQALQPQLRTSGSNGSKMAFNLVPTLIIKRQSITSEDQSQLGRPLCEKRQISTLSGYVKCDNVDIDLAATSAEKEKVISFMESGFFYE